MSTILAEHPVIQEKALLIADMVSRSLEMSIFKQAERDLRHDEQAQALLLEVQRKQGLGEEVEEWLDRLEQLDVVRRFTVAQETMAELMSHTTRILAATVSDRLDLVTEEEGGCCGCPGALGGCDSSGTSCSSMTACGPTGCAV